jgi:hypothetical protein
MEVCIKTLVIFLNKEGAPNEDGGTKILFTNAHKGKTNQNQVPFRERFIPTKQMHDLSPKKKDSNKQNAKHAYIE